MQRGFFIVLSAVLFLGACDGRMPDFPKSFAPVQAQSDAQTPLKDIEVPDQTTLVQAQMAEPKSIVILENENVAVLEPLKTNTDAYFSPALSDNGARIERLEKFVKYTHRDETIPQDSGLLPEDKGDPETVVVVEESDVLEPLSLQRVHVDTTIPDDMVEQVSKDLNKVERFTMKVDTTTTDAGNSKKVVSVSTKEEVIVMEEAVLAEPATRIQGIRTGVHKGYVRIVFDLSAPAEFNVNLDNTENLIIVEFADTGSALSVQEDVFKKIPLLESYKMAPQDNATDQLAVIQLSRSTRILNETVLPAGAGQKGVRLVIDLAI